MASELSFIPEWNSAGVLPAVSPLDSDSGERSPSPYAISIIDLVRRFGVSKDRQKLLSGLLKLRAELHRNGLNQGFQWIDGSFLENVEGRENRSPNDIDIVTFFYIPDGYSEKTLLQAFPSLFDRVGLKEQYSVDSFYVPLNQAPLEKIIELSTYWYGQWSHTRNGEWKGYLQIDLAGADDEQARLQLDQLNGEGGGQE